MLTTIVPIVSRFAIIAIMTITVNCYYSTAVFVQVGPRDKNDRLLDVLKQALGARER